MLLLKFSLYLNYWFGYVNKVAHFQFFINCLFESKWDSHRSSSHQQY
jgi:hypothetical protein